MSEPTKRIQLVCEECGSTDVRRDATCSWSVEQQEWVVECLTDLTTCENCDGEEVHLVEVDLKPIDQNGPN